MVAVFVGNCQVEGSFKKIDKGKFKSRKGFKLVKGIIPTLKLPETSHQKEEKHRKGPTKRLPPVVPERVAYLRFEELLSHSKKICSVTDTKWAVLRSADDYLALGQVDCDANIQVKIVFQGTFNATVTYLGCVIRKLYDVEKSGLPSLLQTLEKTSWCLGSKPRSSACTVLIDNPGTCNACIKHDQIIEERVTRKITLHTPLTTAGNPALINEVKELRQKLKEKDRDIERIKTKLQQEAVPVDDIVEKGLELVLANANIEDPFLKLFYQEQQKARMVDPRGMRWNPMLIRFAIYLHYQSPRAYEALRNTQVLCLPNKSSLRDFTSFTKPSEGFQEHILLELQQAASELKPEKHFVCLMHDEMTIRGDLVYDHPGGQIIGFVNPEAWDFKKGYDTKLATHVLVFMVVGVNNNLKKVIGYFSTRTATADILFPLLWEAVSLVEETGLKVISSTSDKASANQRLYRMHGPGQVVHQTENPFADEDDRPLFFISDPPHLIKTIRNNLASSKTHGTRYMWNNGQHVLWEHIKKVYDDQVHVRLTKLSYDHVYLTPATRMSVNLAAQVLSDSVYIVLKRYYGTGVVETAKFVKLCDRMFDCLNTRSFHEATETLKPDREPYDSITDARFEFLDSVENYLDEWKASTQRRIGFTPAEKAKMFLSYQTHEGILTTLRGFKGACGYLLNHGVPYVFSNVFCQDPLESHFRRHRGLGHRSRNPSAYEFAHQENKLAIQRNLAQRFEPKGNVTRLGNRRLPIEVDEEPVPKIKRH